MPSDKVIETKLPQHFGMQDIQIDNIELVYDGYFKMFTYRFRHRLFRGGWSQPIERELFERGSAVAVLPYDPSTDQVVLIEQVRVGAMVANCRPWQLEIVAGVIDKESETVEEVAIREAQEEAGLTIQTLTPMVNYLSTSGGCSERLHLFLAEIDASKAHGIHGLENENEDIAVHVVSLSTALSWINEGKIENAATIIALQWLALSEHRRERSIGTKTE